MGKLELPAAYESEAEPYRPLVPIVQLLLRSGNSLSYDQQQQSSGFMPTQGGWVCYLNDPIDFDLVSTKFELPTKVRLSRAEDTIFDERTWVTIEGPKQK
jgi:hypothetical protein